MKSNSDLRSEINRGILERHMRAVLHMRQQRENRQFGLVFGAGIGKDLGFPDWPELVRRISTDPAIDSLDMITNLRDVSTRTQLLYQKYRSGQLAAMGATAPDKLCEMKIRAGWRKIVHRALYDGVPDEIDDLLKNDRYLEAYAEIIKDSPLTVTYNFDDTIEKILKKNRKSSENETRGYTTYWSGNVQLNAKSGGIVYHPNGFLPRNLKERPSDHLVFLEDSFVDQLIDSMAGQYASLSTHISRTTCLFIGLSLDDPGLKHLLRQSAKSFPGHYHYYVRFVRDDAAVDEHSRELEVSANFESYNLITLHLKAPELKALAGLLLASASEFDAFAEEISRSAYRFYVVGAVSVGKSTTVSHFRSLLTQDEWLEERAPGMEKDPSLLTPDEKTQIDNWVAEQVARKNVRLEKTSPRGIHVVDRAPLDAFAFTPIDKWKEKAELLRGKISPGQARDRKIVPGHVIFLSGDTKIMAGRAISLHKVTDSNLLHKQQELLRCVYQRPGSGKGVTVVDTRDRTPAEVVKIVARIIFLSEYVELGLHEILTNIEAVGYAND